MMFHVSSSVLTCFVGIDGRVRIPSIKTGSKVEKVWRLVFLIYGLLHGKYMPVYFYSRVVKFYKTNERASLEFATFIHLNFCV